jgi:hypothetical protein
VGRDIVESVHDTDRSISQTPVSKYVSIARPFVSPPVTDDGIELPSEVDVANHETSLSLSTTHNRHEFANASGNEGDGVDGQPQPLGVDEPPRANQRKHHTNTTNGVSSPPHSEHVKKQRKVAKKPKLESSPKPRKRKALDVTKELDHACRAE